MATRAAFIPAGGGHELAVLGSAARVKARAAETGGAFDVVEIESTPGGDIVPHRHPWGEIYYVLEGAMTVQIGARHHDALPGDLVHIPPRALHGFTVTSERARFLHVSVGDQSLKLFEEYDAIVPHTPTLDDVPAILEVNGRYGVEVVLPNLV
jgi:quercetin dioxygenase-like cupin family protein